MFAHLLVWATLGTSIGSAIESTGTPAANDVSREWTNASGAKRVRAILVRAEGEKLWLRRPDGNLATTTVSQLSQADRQYVATNPLKSASTSPMVTFATKLGEKVQSIADVPRWSSASQIEVPVGIVPAAVVYVRVSRGFLEDYVQREVSRTKPVRDYILGTRVVGESDTQGKTRLELLPSKGRLAGKISFEGTVHAKTLGYNGPVVLHQIARSRFQASKTIELNDSGLKVTQAVTSAPTRLETTNISTCLPRLRGRIATRIAWRRVSSSHQRAEEITAQHTAATISSDFDKSTNASVAKLQDAFKSKIPDLDVDRGSMIAEVRFRTNKDSVEMAMIRVGAGLEEGKLRPPIVEGNPDVAVRVHRTLLVRAIAHPQVREDLAPLFAKLKKRFEQKELAAIASEGELSAASTKWSIDPDWLTLDFNDPSN